MGDYAAAKQWIRPDDLIIAADSGYRHALALDVRPQVLLGDFDSLDEIPEGVELHRVSAEKDFTDTELAIQWARDRGICDFLLLGVIGTRMDHTLTNILHLTRFLDEGIRAEIRDEHNRIWITDSEIEITGMPGDILSLIPLTTCEGVTTERLQYPLQNATLRVGQGVGVSNVMREDSARVTVTEGRLLVMVCGD